MESLLLSIHPSDPLWLVIAYLFGLLVKTFGLPPLIGYLLAGFFLHIAGAERGEFLNTMADLGITMLLFTIGLKLKLHNLLKPEVWGVATLHMGFITLVITLLMIAMAQTGMALLTGMSLQTAALIGFALSFSSTVFAIKILDDQGAVDTRHGRIAIGVLVIQDIIAVIFLALSAGKVPSMWAIALLLLIPSRFLFYRLLEKSGHGELLVLYGISLALGGADIFELVGMKGDVGALVFGMLLANHAKSNEMAKALLAFKDLFLIGFFLSIGMTALPGWNELIIALVLILFLPVKVAAYFGLLSLFSLRASTSWRTSLNLSNYSEFGLIVGAIAASEGLLPVEWLAVFAILVSISFIISAPVVRVRDKLYQAWRPGLKKFERSKRLSGEEDIVLSNIKVIIFGMGRMGSAAYSAIHSDFQNSLIGVEVDPDKVVKLNATGMNVIAGDGTNPDFWARAPGLIDSLEWVLLTLPSHTANMEAAKQLNELGYQGEIAATTKYPEEQEELKSHNVRLAFNIYTEAGIGFADEMKSMLSQPSSQSAGN